MKTCRSCNNQKPLEDFPTQIKRGKKIHLGNCRVCHNEKQREAYYRNHEKRKEGLRLQHAAHRDERNAKLREYNKRPDVQEKRKLKHQENREANLEKNWKQGLKRRYGFTYEQYIEMLAAQDGRCAICGTTESWSRSNRFAVDHDHSSGKIRALLCHKCNRVIGSMEDDPELLRKAADYIESFRD